MPDEMTTTGALGGGRRKEEESVGAVEDAIETLKQAMLDEGQDPGSVDAKLHAVIPNNEGNIVGNYADLQRMGAIAQEGVLPTPPGEEDVETDDITEAFIEVPGPIDDNTGRPTTRGNADADANVDNDDDTDSMTKAELQAELDERGIEYPSSATKADLQALLG